MSLRATPAHRSALAITLLESGLTSTSATARRRANALSAIGWVTKTRGRLIALIAALTCGMTFSAIRIIELAPELAIFPVLAGIKQRAEIADLLLKSQQLIGDIVRRAINDQPVADRSRASPRRRADRGAS